MSAVKCWSRRTVVKWEAVKDVLHSLHVTACHNLIAYLLYVIPSAPPTLCTYSIDTLQNMVQCADCSYESIRRKVNSKYAFMFHHIHVVLPCTCQSFSACSCVCFTNSIMNKLLLVYYAYVQSSVYMYMYVTPDNHLCIKMLN